MNKRFARLRAKAAHRGLVVISVLGVVAIAGCGSTGPASVTTARVTTAGVTTAGTSAGATGATGATGAATSTTTAPAPTPVPLAPVTTATVAAATSTVATPAEAVALKRYLLKAGEEPGFTLASGSGTFSTLKSWVAFTQLTAADARLLRSEGFMAAAQQNIGNSTDGGASFVEEFTTEAGARREAVNDAKQATESGFTVKFFSVSTLPNSHGVLISTSGQAGTDLYWTEGRCTLWIGNGSETSTEAQVTEAAEAVYRRTKGVCP